MPERVSEYVGAPVATVTDRFRADRYGVDRVFLATMIRNAEAVAMMAERFGTDQNGGK